MNFSICIIARDEELSLPVLASYLKEYQEAGGEVFLLDTGSTDKTAQVSAQLGFRTYHNPRFNIIIDGALQREIEDLNTEYNIDNPDLMGRVFDFASARNYIASMTSTDWVYVVDCDELLPHFDFKALNKLIIDNPNAGQIYHHFIWKNLAGEVTHNFDRCGIYNKKRAKWVGVVHETLVADPNIDPPIHTGTSIVESIHHQDISKDRMHRIRGLNYAVYKDPSMNERNWFYLGREFFHTEQWSNALSAMKVRMNKREGWFSETAEAYIYAAKASQKLQRKEAIIVSYLMKAVSIDTTRRGPLAELTDYYYKKSDHTKAAAFASAALEVKPVFFSFPENALLNEGYLYKVRYWARWWLGDLEGATKDYYKALELLPDDPQLLHDKQFFN